MLVAENLQESQTRVWFITGTSAGVGAELVRLVRDRGHIAVGGSRREGIDGPPLDLRDRESCQRAIERAVERHGRIDVLANVAGVGAVGSVEETVPSVAFDVMETNFWGPFALTQYALPYMRQKRAGHIVNVSSLSGRIASAGVGVYAASKFALEGLSEALAREVKDFGIRVTVIEPGGIRTDWVETALASAGATPSAYPAVQQTSAILADSPGRQVSTARDVASAILRAVEMPDERLRIPVGPDAFERITVALAEQLEQLEQAGRRLASSS